MRVVLFCNECRKVMQDGMCKTCGAAIKTAGHSSLFGKLYERRQCSRQVDGRVELI